MTKRDTVVVTGAGVSTDSGIPDFRSAGGVWERFDMNEFHVSRFRADPDRFWAQRVRLIAAMDYLDATPNAAHEVISDAAATGRVSTVITQNVDGLHAKAGTPANRLLELHGNGARCVCTICFRRVATTTALSTYVDSAPRCRCGGVLKPDVVLFGEPVHGMPAALRAVSQATRLVVAGTSLTVHPAAGLVDAALAAGAEVHIINRDPTPYDDPVDAVHRGDVATTLRDLLTSP